MPGPWSMMLRTPINKKFLMPYQSVAVVKIVIAMAVAHDTVLLN